MTAYENIPDELRALKRWVCVAGGKKPLDPIDGSPASVSDSSTWGTFDEARRALDYGCCEWLGFVFAGDGIVGIDIDHAITPEGFICPEASAAVRELASYTEISKSGNGLHILVEGELPFNGRNNGEGWEIYARGRFFVLTGLTICGYTLSRPGKALRSLIEARFADGRPLEGTGEAGQTIWPGTYPEVTGTPIPIGATYPPVRPGMRHLSLVSYCGQIKRAGAGAETVEAMAQVANQRYMVPPLPAEEVKQIARSIMRYRG